MNGASAPQRVIARALVVGDRIDVAGLERPDLIASTPLAFRVGEKGYVALFRFGAVVTLGLTPLEEDEVLDKLKGRIQGARARGDDESANIDVGEDEASAASGGIRVKALDGPRFLVIAEALAKTVALGRDEREVNKVFDVIEPFAARLAADGRPPVRRRAMLRLIGQALIAQQRASGRVAVEEKPDILWDRPDLERLYARLEDEYELKERGQALKRKFDVIVETARALTDLIDADRSWRLEATIVALIVVEVVLAVVQIALVVRWK